MITIKEDVNDTKERFKRTTAEAFDNERYSTVTHFTDDRFMFKEPTRKSKHPVGNSWIVGIVILSLFAFAAYPIVRDGITVIETEMALEEERAAVEEQQTRLAKQCQSWMFDEINPGVYQCFDDTGRKTKIVRVK